MPRFKFRLERVLGVRRHQEERERLLFGLATRSKLQAEMRLEEVRERIRQAVESAARLTGGRPTIEDLVRSHEYRLALVRREDRAIVELAEATRRFEEQREKLIEARKKKRVLERLREKRHEEWRKDEENRSQDELDEIGLHRFVRRHESTGYGETTGEARA